ncbi:MAG: radical SAM family heme chaperone HemW [Verrucomicrobiia bacterium]
MNLYLHIPFCPKICPYCSFYKEASDRNKTAGFVEAVLREAQQFQTTLGQRVAPRTIFVGGGTPTALPTPLLLKLFRGLQRLMDFSMVKEWTIEMNPATVSLEKATELRQLGVTRVSMGVQSWDAMMLERLGRVHSAAQADRSFAILREAGFDNVNLDLMFAIPGQSAQTWIASLEKTFSLQPEHLSAYCLTYEEDTAYLSALLRGELVRETENEIDFFAVAMERAEAAGYHQYEISNYARPGYECQHNLGYWRGEDCLGLGPSAVSTVNGRRWKNVPDTTLYMARIGQTGHARIEEEELDGETQLAEQLAFGLRTSEGVSLSKAKERLACLEELETEGLLERTRDRVRLTRRGRMVADEIASLVV